MIAASLEADSCNWGKTGERNAGAEMGNHRRTYGNIDHKVPAG
jgi:hypothetical protein